MKMRTIIPFGLLIVGAGIAAAGSAPAAPAQAAAPGPAAAALAPGEGREVADQLATELVRRFVFPDQARVYAAMLRKNVAAGRYDAGTRAALASLISDDLMAVHKDGHLHVSVTEGAGAGGGSIPSKAFPPFIQSAKWIAPGVAYIRPSIFLSNDTEIGKFRTFMRDHRDAKAIIFDLRNHHGGGLGEMDAIFPYLFAKKTPLVRMEVARSIYDDNDAPIAAGPTLKLVKDAEHATFTHYALPGQATPLRRAKIYLLVSNATASAAEHFSLAMKSTGRAILIGENTAGANHFGGPRPVGDHFSVWMPVGRTYDIKSGKDWEGVGVAPDIAADPKLALVVALEKAGVPPAQAIRLDALEVPAEPVHRDKLRAR
jgi:hypothetical protein